VDTYTLEALMRDGKALQAGTSHYLGQGFARAFNVRYTARDGTEQYPYATSWGASTRLVGGLVMAHGDERGLRLPPRVAPKQVVIVPILRADDQSELLERAAALADQLRAAGVRVELDDRPEHRPGFKFNEWELKGVPLRIEIGARDLSAGVAIAARRDTGAKEPIPLATAPLVVQQLLSEMQASLFSTALAEQERRTLRHPAEYERMIDFLRGASGFAWAAWCGGSECETRVKNASSATIRCLPLNAEPDPNDACICCSNLARHLAVWAQAY
jgi:prolyl-tRNA synthetase